MFRSVLETRRSDLLSEPRLEASDGGPSKANGERSCGTALEPATLYKTSRTQRNPPFR